MLVKIYSAAPVGIDAVQVTIEVHSKPGFDFVLVGLPDIAVKESHERYFERVGDANRQIVEMPTNI